jgi:hypothetical protein
MADYVLHGVSLSTLNSELDLFWTALKTNVALRADVLAKGIPVDDLLDRKREEVITLKTDKAHLDPVTVGLIVAFAPTINTIGSSLWQNFALPWLLKKLGNNAIETIPKTPKDQS